MKVVIEKLNAEILENQFGFIYDGAYWVKYPTPIKLSGTEDGKYLVTIDGASIGDISPDPIEFNSDLLKLLIGLLPSYMQARGRAEQVTQMTPEQVTQWMAEYLSVPDERIKLAINLGPHGAAISPGNEFTFTMVQGVTCEFEVTYKTKDGQLIKDTIFYHPVVISTNFLMTLFGDDVESIESVKVNNGDDGWSPFFGAGMI